MPRNVLTTRTGRTLTIVAAAAALAACGSGGETAGSGTTTEAAETRTVEHAMGATEVPADVERVVVLDTGELDAVVSLGVTPVGAVTTDVSTSLVSYLEDELAETEPVGTIGEPNLEAIAALEPDLILSNTVRHEDLYDEFSAIAPTVFAGDVGDTWKETLRLAGDALGEREQADELIADYEARAADVGGAVTGGDPAGTEVSVVRFLPGQIRLYGEASFIGTVLADAGFGRPAVQQVPETFVEVSAEQISQADGDVVFTAVYGAPEDTAVADVTGGELWNRLTAVQAGNAHEVSDDTWMLGIGVTAANLVLNDIESILG
ncbi:iron-siderophore ABC transporter substrate-binding protein [Georgenia sp. M64]|uniref:ABC transporter substrate-binding protein n=1 Tax=Georgenia sp. M64 TaxID=3120520 RepID=UPI0030E582DF